jgi:hypothetical protein
MAVRRERHIGAGVAQNPLYGHDVAPLGNGGRWRRGALDRASAAPQGRPLACHSPAMVDGVREGWARGALAHENPTGGFEAGPELAQVCAQPLDQRGRQEVDSLAAVLRRPDLSPCRPRWTCLDTERNHRRKSMSPSWMPESSPRRRPAKAASPTKAPKGTLGGFPKPAHRSADGITMAASLRRRRGSVTPIEGSEGMRRSETAPRKTALTLFERVWIVDGARPLPSIVFIHCSIWDFRRERRGSGPKVVDATVMSIALNRPR